jgi:hypothetical protein
MFRTVNHRPPLLVWTLQRFIILFVHILCH